MFNFFQRSKINHFFFFLSLMGFKIFNLIKINIKKLI